MVQGWLALALCALAPACGSDPLAPPQVAGHAEKPPASLHGISEAECQVAGSALAKRTRRRLERLKRNGVLDENFEVQSPMSLKNMLKRLGSLDAKSLSPEVVAKMSHLARHQFETVNQAGLFGSLAARAISTTLSKWPVDKGPYDGRTRESAGNIQRVFANFLEYQNLESLVRNDWQAFESKCPEVSDSHFLWKGRASTVIALLEEVRSALDRVGKLTTKEPLP